MVRLTIEDMQEIAESRGGKCLSTEYINSNTKLEWQCTNGHTWLVTPSGVKQGNWCPECYNNRRKKKCKLTIEEMQEIAESRWGKCLSTKYTNGKTKLQWECSEGHRWLAVPSSVKYGQWCPVCGRKRGGDKLKLTIEEMHEIAEGRGGKCLSTEYIDGKIELEWQCKYGHKWEASPSHIKRGSWCPHCRKGKIGYNLKLTIEEMQEIAEGMGGKCLSTKYIDNKTKLEWECEKGHTWWATPNSIHQGNWCPKCAIKKKADKLRLTIEEIQGIAKSRRGKCLSTKYLNSHTKLKWQCSEGHIWWATPSSVKNQGCWCPECAIYKRRLTIEEIQGIAKSRGGKCLSTKYIDEDTKLEWECADGHRWRATLHGVKGGSWCPKCTKFIGEKIFQKTLSCIYQEEFLKDRPQWNMGYHNRPLEYDAICEGLCLIGEYGHSWHQEEERILNDIKKEKNCKEKGYKFFRINDTQDYKNIVIDIIKALDDIDIPLPDPISYIYYKDLPIYLPSKIMKMKEIAESRGGKCLSTEYINSDTKLQWQCKDEHTWWARPSQIKSGRWCRKCGYIKAHEKFKLTIKEMQKIAKNRDGECLSKEYIDSKTKLEWKCNEGHTWWATPNYIQHERWCSVCKKKNRSDKRIIKMQEIAKSRDGKCLSIVYIHGRKKLKWQCKNGHMWWSTPNSIQRGSWCSVCKKKNRSDKRIIKMQEIAKSRGGRCLSIEYINDVTKLEWKCGKCGHRWWSTPNNVKYKTWCPKCAIDKFKLTIDEMKQIAKNRGGKCLSTEYTNNRTKLEWQCKEGHRWWTAPDQIKQGNWCPICGRKESADKRKLSIEEIQNIAKIKGGKCLSKEYINNHTKLEWKCAYGHKWLARPKDIKRVVRGNWCPICARNKRKKIKSNTQQKTLDMKKRYP